MSEARSIDDDVALRSRSLRTLAWLGDAAFEQEVRLRVARRGDYPTDRLDAIKAEVVRAEAQAALLAAIEHHLDEAERALARRGRNTRPPLSARGRRNTQAYREATAFEILVAHWTLAGEEGRSRFHALVGDALEAAIEEALARRGHKPRRG